MTVIAEPAGPSGAGRFKQPVERTRPLCVFPARAQWDGKGDKTKLDSFVCRAPGHKL